MASTAQFVAEVRSVAPNASGDAVSAVEAGYTIVRAFAMAGVLSAVAIAILLLVTLRQWRAVVLTIAPIAVAGVMTFASCALLAIPINLENMIALPLLLGIGVAFNIYLVAAARSGVQDLLSSSVSRGVMFSALSTGTSFATLMLSTHPGTSSMGVLLLIALGWILVTTVLVTPALDLVLSSGTGVGKRAPEGAQC
jgi:predicted RND superfamily exporter protein